MDHLISGNTMKAVVCPSYAPPEVLQIREIAKPVRRDGEILVKIMAAPVNSADIRIRGLVVEGFMRIVMRLVLGFNKPRKSVLGMVFSGIMEQTGKR